MCEGPREWKLLATGIDTCDLGLYVRWDSTWAELIAALDEKKAEAAGTEGVLWRESALGPCIVMPAGRRMYRYVIRTPDAEICIQSRQEWKGGPNVYISPSARSIWRLGIRAVADVMCLLIRELGGTIDRVQVSRVDLAADFSLPGGLSLDFMQQSLVSRSELTQAHFGSGQLETVYVGGTSSAIRARLYNKSREILVNGEKLWFIDIWKVDVLEDIWRVEIQLRREALKQFGIDSLDDLLEKVGGVWSHLCSEWMSLRLQDSSNTSRRTVHVWWQAVQKVADRFGPSLQIERNLEPLASVDVTWHKSHIAGCFAALAARMGLTDISAAFLMLQRVIREYWRERDWDSEILRRRIQLGLELPEDEDDAAA